MSFWKKKKYCPYCGSELKTDGSCPNKDCIAYKGRDRYHTKPKESSYDVMANIDSNRNIVSVVRRIVRDIAMEIQAAHSSGKSGKGRSREETHGTCPGRCCHA